MLLKRDPYVYLNLVIPRNNVPVLPAELMTQPPHGAIFPSRLQPQHTQSLRDHHALLVVVWRRYTLEGLEALHGLRAALSLVGNHAANGAPEHLRRRAVVPWATTLRVVSSLLAEEGLVLDCCRRAWLVDVRGCEVGLEWHTLRPEELAGDVEGFASDDDDLLTVKQLLRDGAGKTAEEMSLAVHHDL